MQKRTVEAKPSQPEDKPATLQLKRTDETQLLLEQITRRWPEYAPAHYALADSYNEETREKAIVSYQRYAKLMPLDPRPWQQLARLYDQLKRLEEAEAAYREVIARDRGNTRGQAELSAFHLRHSQIEKAKTGFSEALKPAADTNRLLRVWMRGLCMTLLRKPMLKWHSSLKPCC